ncbi:hypothetical protein AHF37_08853, partial [Paragonimus kellicotti]
RNTSVVTPNSVNTGVEDIRNVGKVLAVNGKRGRACKSRFESRRKCQIARFFHMPIASTAMIYSSSCCPPWCPIKQTQRPTGKNESTARPRKLAHPKA